MTYSAQNLENQVRGDTWVIKLSLKYEDGNPVNIVGNKYWFTLKNSKEDLDTSSVVAVGPIEVVGDDALNGLVTFTVPSSQTEITPKTYHYDIQEVALGGRVSTLALGKLKVVQDVTLAKGYDDPPIFPTSGISDGDILVYVEIDQVWTPVSPQQAGILKNVVEDLTPELGGTLDALNNDIQNVNSLSFTNGPASPLAWNLDDATLDVPLNDSVTLQVGQEELFYAKAIEPITDGEVVMFAGAQGGHLLIAKCDMSSPGFDPSYIVGLATQTFATNEFGYVTSLGKVRNLNTLQWAEGTILYVDQYTPGALTDVEPLNGTHNVQAAAVVRSHQTQGTLLVRITHIRDLSELHRVNINAPTNGQTLVYENGFWVNGEGIAEETDPTVPPHVKSITQEDIDSWNDITDGQLSVLEAYVLSPTAEEKLTFSPYAINDLGYARLRGSTFSFSGTPLSDSDIDNMFDGTGLFAQLTGADFGGSPFLSTWTMEFTLPVSMSYATYFGISFGARWNRAKYVKIESFSGGVWKTIKELTNNPDDTVFGIVPGTGPNTTTSLKITLGSPQSVTGEVRLAHVFGYNFVSPLMTTLYPSRMGGQFYGEIYINGEIVPHASLAPKSGAWFGGGVKYPVINTSGVMEVGKYIDFHATGDSTSDYNGRLVATGTTIDLIGLGNSGLTVNGSAVYTAANFSETDPTVPQHVKNITQANIDAWNAGGGGGSAPATPTVEGTLYGKSSSVNGTTVALGYSAASAEVTASGGIAIGISALKSNNGGLNNVAIGDRALELGIYNPDTQSPTYSLFRRNMAIGYRAARSAKGSLNTAIGFEALSSYTELTGDTNLAIGPQAMSAAAGTATANLAIGAFSLQKVNNDAIENAAIGADAGQLLEYGRRNTFIGRSAANTLVGAPAGQAFNCENNIVIGYNAQPSSTTLVKNEITFGNDLISRLRIPGLGIDLNKDTLTEGQALVWDDTLNTFAVRKVVEVSKLQTAVAGATTVQEIIDAINSL